VGAGAGGLSIFLPPDTLLVRQGVYSCHLTRDWSGGLLTLKDELGAFERL
jgi:hypothetical protein